MSASDAAPLPRLGEVFFDVRGESRSMRLSWYADTGVAVFSIWQADTCTGTFRLPIADLPRMIQALADGPRGRPDVTGDQPSLPGARRRIPAPPPAQPGRALPDADIETGARTAAIDPQWPPPSRPAHAAGPDDAGQRTLPGGRHSGRHSDPAGDGYWAGDGYPAGPAGPGYPGADAAPPPGRRQAPPDSGYQEGSPARPYVTGPGTGGYGPVDSEWAGIPPGGRYPDEPAGESFPYGPARRDRESGQGERFPGRQ